MSTDQEPDYQAARSGGLTIAEAADYLGVSENAVRQRIKRGTIEATKVDGLWRVQIHDHQTDQEPASGRDQEVAYPHRLAGDQEADPPPTTVPMVSPAARAQLAAIRDELVQPLVDQIAAQAEQIGRLTAELDQMRAQAAAEEAATRPQEAQAAPAPAAMQDPPRGLLARLRTIFSGP